jgi:hypothetical protein
LQPMHFSSSTRVMPVSTSLRRAILLYLRSVNVNITPRELYVLHFGNIEEYKQKAFKGNITAIITEFPICGRGERI